MLVMPVLVSAVLIMVMRMIVIIFHRCPPKPGQAGTKS